MLGYDREKCLKLLAKVRDDFRSREPYLPWFEVDTVLQDNDIACVISKNQLINLLYDDLCRLQDTVQGPPNFSDVEHPQWLIDKTNAWLDARDGQIAKATAPTATS